MASSERQKLNLLRQGLLIRMIRIHLCLESKEAPSGCPENAGKTDNHNRAFSGTSSAGLPVDERQVTEIDHQVTQRQPLTEA